MKSRFRRCIFSLLTTSLSSCFYSTNYVAKYDITPTSTVDRVDAEIRETIIAFSEEYSLVSDEKYQQTDTLGFFGQADHYFKYWTTKQGNTIRLMVNYTGSMGGKQQPSYDKMLNQLTEHLNLKYNVSTTEISERSTRKKIRVH